MNFLRLLVLSILLLLMSCVSTRPTTNLFNTLTAFQNSDSKIVLVAAHRGAHMNNFENSIASTKEAIRLGVDIIEVDVRTTKDRYLILMHDSSIDRTTTGKGKVEEMTLAEIRKYKLRGPYGNISPEVVPTFEEFLQVTKGKIMVDVDMKTDNVSGIVGAVSKAGINNEVFYFDNDYHQLDEIKKIDRSAQIMPRAYSYHMADSAITKYSPPTVHIDPGFYTDSLTAMLRKNKARVWINTLGEVDCNIRYGNGVKVIDELLKNGANMIQTDEPELLLQLLSHKGLHQ